MLDAIERIEKYVSKGRAAFEQDELIQTWVVYHLQIIGEAAAKVGREFHEQYPSILWPQVIAMRNVLVHDYFGVDLEEIWHMVERSAWTEEQFEEACRRVREEQIIPHALCNFPLENSDLSSQNVYYWDVFDWILIG